MDRHPLECRPIMNSAGVIHADDSLPAETSVVFFGINL